VQAGAVPQGAARGTARSTPTTAPGSGGGSTSAVRLPAPGGYLWSEYSAAIQR